MAFKLKPPYDTVIPNVYFRDMEDGELGRAEKNGTIILNEEMKDPSQIDEVIGHEKIHLEQMRRGDLDYDDKHDYWKGKRYLRSKMKDRRNIDKDKKDRLKDLKNQTATN